MNIQKLQALESAAKQATNDDWEHGVVKFPSMEEMANSVEHSLYSAVIYSGDLHGVFVKGSETIIAHTGNGPTSEANATYIAQADPRTILELIAAVKAMKEGM